MTSAIAAVAVLSSLITAAHAQATVGVVVTGEASMQPQLSATIGAWLQQQGRVVVAAALPPTAIDTIVDCIVIEVPACARTVVETEATSDAVVVVNVEAAPSREGRDVTIVGYWFAKGRDPVVQRANCSQCPDAAVRDAVENMMFSLSGTTPRVGPTPVAIQQSPPADSEPALDGLALGVELGEPTSATVGWFADRIVLAGAIGTGTRAGPGLSLHADVQVVVARLAGGLSLRTGLGARYYHHGYEPASIDELPDSHYGVRAAAVLAIDRGALQLYAELAPGLDLKRTRSCSLVSGPRSICPHSQDSPMFAQFVIGARWFLSK